MEKLWNKNYNLVLTGNFLMYFSFQMLVPLLPLYLSDRFGANKEEIGLVLVGYAVTSLVIRLFSGYIVDTFDRRKVVLIFYFLFSSFFVGYLVAGSLIAFTVIRTLHGLPFGGSTVANSTAAIDVLPSSRRAEGIGFYGLSGNLAMAIGPMIGLSLYHNTGNYQLLFCLCLATSLVGLYIMTKVHGVKHGGKQWKAAISQVKEAEVINHARGRYKGAGFDRFFLTIAISQAISIIAFSFSFGILATYVAIYAKEELNIAEGSSMFFTLLATGLILSRFQGAKALKQGRITYNAKIGIVISLFAYILFAAIHQPWAMFVSAFIIGLGNGHMYPAFQNMFIGMAPNSKRGTANSTILTSWDVGVGIGIILGGVLAEHFTYHSAFWAAAAVNLIGVLVFFLHGSKHYNNHKLHS